MEDNDVQLQLKKRARRRLVGAVAFAGLAAVVLPMIMDQEPKQATQDVEIRIPGQDEKPFAPKFAAAPAAKPWEAAKPTEAPAKPAPEVVKAPPVAEVQPAVVTKSVEKQPDKVSAKSVEKVPEKLAEKAAEKPIAKPVEKPAEKPVEKAAKPDAEAQRAAAILAGKSPDSAAPAATGGQQVILIGAFSDQANVKILQKKLSELGIKVFTEPLDTPQGKKTRVRAGPFASREAAEAALEKMKRIGVSGVLAAKQ